jgi:hypothetical protein
MLVMNVLPLADLDAFFSDAIVNRFRLRPLTIEPDGPAFPYGPEGSELVFSFSFEAPQSRDCGAPMQDGCWRGNDSFIPPAFPPACGLRSTTGLPRQTERP